MAHMAKREGWVAACLLGCLAAAASAGLSGKRVGRWAAPDNRARLRIAWRTLPEGCRSLGTIAPAAGKRPFLLWVSGGSSAAGARIEMEVLGNTSVAIAARLCTTLRLTPDQAVELPCMRSVARIRDPMLVVVRADATLEGALAGKRDFTPRKLFALLEKSIDAAYRRPLATYHQAYLKLLERTERLWRMRKKLAAPEFDEQMRALQAGEAALGMDQQLKSAPPKGAGPKPPALGRLEREALAVYRRQASDENPVARAGALSVFRPFDSSAVATLILGFVRRGDSWTVWEAGRLLGAMAAPQTLKVLSETLSTGNARQMRACLLALEHRACPQASARILELFRGRAIELRLAAVRAMGGQKDSGTAAALGDALHDDDPEIRILAAQAVARRGLGRHAALVRTLVKAPEWGVRKAALEALARLDPKTALPVLLEALEHEPGIVRGFAHRWLVDLSGKPFDFRAARWRKWWAGAQDAFEPAAPAVAETARKKAATLLRARGWRGKSGFGPVRTTSRRVIYLLDIGASMGEKAADGTVKLEKAKQALADAILELPKGVRFNVIGFAGELLPWRTKLGRASLRRSAAAFVKKLRAVQAAQGGKQDPRTSQAGTTQAGVTLRRTQTGTQLVSRPGTEQRRNLYGALLAAFGVLDPEPFAVRTPPSADTVILIADGPPTLGEVLAVPRLAAILAEIDRTRGVVLDVVGMTAETAQALAPLAEATGGLHVGFRG